ncbi:uncharacterized protein C8Q71DRAFT_572756 [Rhodofomes roseus]|uniref:Uncharacterized protein n=1 Tax=Rhodofomes roseus TaxID=34475 RepID=A0ABQ8KK97_9APHY|nr:uncharacterized protein C8Q71DRAFT_572756 [Rhodofomes roseus]KAH9838012.1 hypothetical protein C8Q71DRAFT_572756 [Rhodofomes roseus]
MLQQTSAISYPSHPQFKSIPGSVRYVQVSGRHALVYRQVWTLDNGFRRGVLELVEGLPALILVDASGASKRSPSTSGFSLRRFCSRVFFAGGDGLSGAGTSGSERLLGYLDVRVDRRWASGFCCDRSGTGRNRLCGKSATAKYIGAEVGSRHYRVATTSIRTTHLGRAARFAAFGDGELCVSGRPSSEQGALASTLTSGVASGVPEGGALPEEIPAKTESTSFGALQCADNRQPWPYLPHMAGQLPSSRGYVLSHLRGRCVASGSCYRGWRVFRLLLLSRRIAGPSARKCVLPGPQWSA